MKFTVILFAALAVAAAIESESIAEKNEGLVPKHGESTGLLRQLVSNLFGGFHFPLFAPIRTTPKPAAKPQAPAAKPKATTPKPKPRVTTAKPKPRVTTAKPKAPAVRTTRAPVRPSPTRAPAQPSPTPAPVQPSPTPAQAQESSPAPAEDAESSPAPAEDAESSPAPAEDSASSPAPIAALEDLYNVEGLKQFLPPMTELMNVPPEQEGLMSKTLDDLDPEVAALIKIVSEYILSRPTGTVNLDDPISLQGISSS